MTPSARKNSAALAVSTIETSAVIACALCFFLMSAKISTLSAPIARRYRSRSPAGLDHTFVGHVRIHESFDPDEVGTGRVRDGERLPIRRCEHLNAEHETGSRFTSRDCGHGGGDPGRHHP